MKKYKPEYMGKVLPSDSIPKMTDFVQNKYDSFSKIYETCRDQSEQINDLKNIEKESSDKSELNVKISAENDTINKIAEKVKDDEKVSINSNVITAKD